jgi:hypothetical protein
MSRRKEDSAMAMYTADKTALESDEIFVDFITGLHDAFVIEDADHCCNRARTAIAICIFTTNLPNIGSLDEALLRPGRCFATIQMRQLSPLDAEAVLRRLLPDDTDAVSKAHQSLFAAGRKHSSLAAIYRAAELRT